VTVNAVQHHSAVLVAPRDRHGASGYRTPHGDPIRSLTEGRQWERV
jgi:hypothetical protein